MSRLSVYLLREVSSLYVIGISVFILLLLIDFLAVWARFLLEYSAPLGVIGRLLAFQMPYFLHLSLPITVVFAVLLATGRLAKDAELKAVYASGVPPLRLLLPLLGFGVLVSGLAVMNNGFLEPRGRVAYERTVASFFYERPPAELQNDVAYSVENQGIFFAGRVRGMDGNPALAELQGVLIILEDGSQIAAPSGVWDSDAKTWSLEAATRIAPDEAPEALGVYSLPFDTRRELELLQPNQLSLDQLWGQIESVQAARGEVRDLLYEFHKRIADASGALIFALLGGALGLQLRGRSAGFAWTVVLLVVFYSLWTLSGSLHERRVLSPLAAAWFTPVITGGIGALLALVRLR